MLKRQLAPHGAVQGEELTKTSSNGLGSLGSRINSISVQCCIASRSSLSVSRGCSATWFCSLSAKEYVIPRVAHECIPPEPLDILYFGPNRLEVVKSLLTGVPHRPELFVGGICSSASESEAGQPSPRQVVKVRVARAGATDRLRARLEASRTCRELRSRPF